MNIDFYRDSTHSSLEEFGYLAQINLAFPALAAIFILLTALVLTPKRYSMLYIDFSAIKPEANKIHARVDIDFDGAVLINGQLAVDRSAYERELKKLSTGFPQPEIRVYAHPLAEFRYIAAFISSSQHAGLKRTVLMDCKPVAYCEGNVIPYITL